MQLLHDRYTIHPRTPFAIARSSTTAYERVRVRLVDADGMEGWGEAAPNAFYKESAETVATALPKLAAIVERRTTVNSLAEIDSIEEQMHAVLRGDASARSAVSAAAHDLLGKKRGEPVWKLFGLDPMTAPPSSFTIVISQEESGLLQRVEEARPYPILKVKLGTERDEWIVQTVRRAAPGKLLRADANAAWDVDRAVRMSKVLADAGFELIEQPLPRDDIEGLRAVTRQSPIPVIADESCMTSSDIPRLDGAVQGINIKLSKCGGLAEARRMVHEAHRRDMRVMLGCMVESSLGITAAAHLAPLMSYADLDGAALLKDDPFLGATIDDGLIRLPADPGLGVKSRARA
jgi:L-alanine-DL-glutamate epimerase-like enolase superfamily enzyme